MEKELTDLIQSKWSKFSTRQIDAMKGDLAELVSMIQKTYGYSKSRAEMEYHEFQLALRPVLNPTLARPGWQGNITVKPSHPVIRRRPGFKGGLSLAERKNRK